MDFWLGYLAVVLILDESGVLPCSISKTGRRLLLTGQGAATQTGHNEPFVRDGELPR